MCELLGMSANVPTDICFSFAGLMQRGGKTGPHKDGWGVAFYEGKASRTFLDPFPSYDSEMARFLKSYPIKSCNVICHIRKANRGRVCLENTHPFVRQLWRRNWTYAHNGQLKGVKTDFELGAFEPVGSTDSEHAFCWILSQLQKRFRKPPQSDKTLWRYLQTLCEQLAERGVFNILLCDGKYLYAHCSTKLCWITRRSPFGRAKLLDEELEIDFHKETTPNDVVTVIATAPLTHDEDWFKANKGEFLVFHKGEVAYTSFENELTFP